MNINNATRPLHTPSNCFGNDDNDPSGQQQSNNEQEKHVEETAYSRDANGDELSQSEHKQDDDDDVNYHHASPSQVTSSSQQLLLDADELRVNDDVIPEYNNNNNNAAPAAVNVGNSRNITRVDGKGLWRSWKRNFNSQFTAILDLVDNSLDASIQNIDQNFHGKCHVSPDTYTYHDEFHNIITKTTGITIINNCITKPRPLQRCLEIYDSSKVDSGKESVGENGVGLKQACATLSDVNFVLVKIVNEDGDGSIGCELGVVAETLQKAEGAYLPAFQFTIDVEGNSNRISTLAQQMKSLFSHPNHSEVAQCIAGYGSPPEEDTSAFESGIQRLCRQFDKLCNGSFADSPYVFAVIVDKIRSDNVEERSGVAGDALTMIHVDNLMLELKKKIPLTYLHIPNSFEFCVGAGCELVDTNYWQKRLMEFSTFTINVGTKIRFDDPRTDPQTCSFRMFCGFDAKAMKDKSEKKCASLYIYSRESGRLITHYVDARTMLGMNAGGSEFCSGLRVLLDDIDGVLPLNPTKQDIAFSEKSCGHILKENLFTEVGAAVKMFYMHHKGKFGNKKTALTKKIDEYKDKIPLIDGELKTEISKLDLTTFEVSSRKLTKNIVGGMTLKLFGVEKVGLDTLYRILPDEPSPPVPEPDTELVSSQPDPDLEASQPDPVTWLGIDDSVEHVSKKRKRGDLVEEVTQVQQAPAATHGDVAPAPTYNNSNYQQRQQYLYNYQYPYMHQSHYHQQQQLQQRSVQNQYFNEATFTANNAAKGSHLNSHAHISETTTNQSQEPASRKSHQIQKNNSDVSRDTAEQNSRANQSEKGPNQTQKQNEGHYESLCTRLTQKLEKASTKLERRKEEYQALVEKYEVLEQENQEMKKRIASLEWSLANPAR